MASVAEQTEATPDRGMIGRIGETRRQLVHGQSKPNIIIPLFLIIAVIPVFFWIGPLRMSPIRLFLLVMFVPLLISWVTGGCGRIRVADILIILFCIWFALSLLFNHGISQIEWIGISAIEVLSPYFLARRYVRSSQDVITIGRVMFWICLVFLPAAAIESKTGIRIYSMAFDAISNTFIWADMPQRMGLYRAQVVFEHPILYGVFVASAFSILYMAPRGNSGARSGLRRAWVSAAATFFALSVGAYLVMFVQFGLILWNRLFRGMAGRWYLLIGLVAFMYVLVDLLSNRTPFEVFITYLTFDQHSAYWRVLIFVHGMANVWGSPLFGIGMNDWVRPFWMYDPTVDNFWLLMAMRHGFPGFFLIMGVYLSAIIPMALAKLPNEVDASQRKALIFVLIGIGVGIMTVHLWGATFIFFAFLLGCGAWVQEVKVVPPKKDKRAARRGAADPKEVAARDDGAETAAAAPLSPYTRFPKIK